MGSFEDESSSEGSPSPPPSSPVGAMFVEKKVAGAGGLGAEGDVAKTGGNEVVEDKGEGVVKTSVAGPSRSDSPIPPSAKDGKRLSAAAAAAAAAATAGAAAASPPVLLAVGLAGKASVQENR